MKEIKIEKEFTIPGTNIIVEAGDKLSVNETYRAPDFLRLSAQGGHKLWFVYDTIKEWKPISQAEMRDYEHRLEKERILGDGISLFFLGY